MASYCCIVHNKTGHQYSRTGQPTRGINSTRRDYASDNRLQRQGYRGMREMRVRPQHVILDNKRQLWGGRTGMRAQRVDTFRSGFFLSFCSDQKASIEWIML